MFIILLFAGKLFPTFAEDGEAPDVPVDPGEIDIVIRLADPVS